MATVEFIYRICPEITSLIDPNNKWIAATMPSILYYYKKDSKCYLFKLNNEYMMVIEEPDGTKWSVAILFVDAEKLIEFLVSFTRQLVGSFYVNMIDFIVSTTMDEEIVKRLNNVGLVTNARYHFYLKEKELEQQRQCQYQPTIFSNETSGWSAWCALM
jgi:hypothetical protein